MLYNILAGLLLIICNMRKWRNGRRAGFRFLSLKWWCGFKSHLPQSKPLEFQGVLFFLCCILCCISFLTTVCFTSIKFLCLIIIKNNTNYLTVFYFKINPYFTKVLSFGVIFRWAWHGKRYRNSVISFRQRGTAINFCKITCKIFISAGRNSI